MLPALDASTRLHDERPARWVARIVVSAVVMIVLLVLWLATLTPS